MNAMAPPRESGAHDGLPDGGSGGGGGGGGESAFLGAAEQAVVMILKGLELQPNYPLDFFGLASLFERVGRVEQAADVYSQMMAPGADPLGRKRAEEALALLTLSQRNKKLPRPRPAPPSPATTTGHTRADRVRAWPIVCSSVTNNAWSFLSNT